MNNRTQSEMIALIEALPKAELHIHIEGTLEPELFFRLADKNKIKIPFRTVEELRDSYQFDDLQSFLNMYYKGLAVLINEEDFYELTIEYLRKAKAQNIKHVEIFFDPQSHLKRGISFQTFFNGILKALQEGKQVFNISSHLIMCFLRDLPEHSALETFKLALPFKENIIAVGLDSAELHHPPSQFKEVYQLAMDNGFLTVAHAGEEGPPEYIWQALKILKVKRIDHGVRCMQDEKLIEYLVSKKIPLTVCPLSNIKLKVFQRLEDHPLKTMLQRGLVVCVNSDDPAYFGGYLNKNFIDTYLALNLTKEEIVKLAKNSFVASFMSIDEKQSYLENINQIIDA